MKIKKEITVPARDIVVGDEVKHYGVVVYKDNNPYDGDVRFVYLEIDSKVLDTEEVSPDYKVDVTREVEAPNNVTVTSFYGAEFGVRDDFDDPGGIILNVPDVTGRKSFCIKADEMIDAIKAVKGLD